MPSQPPRPAAKSKSRSKSQSRVRSGSRGQRPSKSPGRAGSVGRKPSPGGDVSTLVAEVSAINTPDRVSPSPKRKTRRGSTPPVKRTQFTEVPEVQPFRPDPSPLTPLGWDVEAAKAAGTQHPSKRECSAEKPVNPNAVLKNALSKFKPNRWRGEKPEPKAKAKHKAKGRGKGRGKGKGNVQLASGVEINPRVISVRPGKGQKRGKGKKK